MIEPRYLESFVLDSIGGRPVNEFEDGHPLDRSFVHDLMARCPVVIVWPDEASEFLPYNDAVPELAAGDGFLLEQPSDDHGRSFQLLGKVIPVEWQDEFGNTYTAASLKGNNFYHPRIIESATASAGYIPYGLQESNVVGRVNRASMVLASRGISTEYVFGIAEPKKLPWPVVGPGVDASTLLNRIEYRQRLIDRYLADHPDADLGSDQIKKLLRSIGSMAFYVTLRATDSPYRLGDLKSDHQREQVFTHANSTLLPRGEQPFDPGDTADLRRFVTTIIAPKTGEYLALMHPDLKHGYLHAFNITALGGIVDLDSVRGTALELGDKPITDDDRAKDIIQVLASISDVYSYRHIQALLTDQVDITPHLVFLASYFAKTASILGSQEAALDYKARVIEAMEERISIFQNDYESDLIEVLDRLEHQLVTEYLEYLGLNVSKAAAVVQQEIHKLGDADLEPIFFLTAHEFRDRIEYFASICVSEYLTTANKAERNGENINPFRAFNGSSERENSDTWKMMQKEIQSLFASALALHLSETESIKDLLPNEIARMSVLRHLFQRVAMDGEEEISRTDELVRTLISTHESALESAMLYEVPTSHFAKGSSFLETYGIGQPVKKYWRSTENVSSSDAMECYEQAGGERAKIEQLTFLDGSLQVRVAPSNPDAVIEEIAFDAASKGNFISDGVKYIDIAFDDLPSYVLIIEKLADGSRKFRMLMENNGAMTAAGMDQNDIPQEEEQNQLLLFA